MSNQTTVIIAGGTGFVGRRLSAVLAAQGHRVVILTRGAPRDPVGPVSFANWNPQDPKHARATLVDLIEGSAGVVNLSGESIGGKRWTDARKLDLIASRVDPTRTLVGAANACRESPGFFLQASGVGYYGTGEEIMTESSDAGDDFLADLAKSWEAPLADLKGTPTRAVVARLGVVLSTTGGALPQMLLPFKLFIGGPIASGNQWLSWIHLHDAVAALAFLTADEKLDGVFNVTSPNPIRNHEFASAAGRVLHRPTAMVTPRFLMKAMLGEQATLVCDGQQAVPERLNQSGFRFSHPHLLGALTELTGDQEPSR